MTAKIKKSAKVLLANKRRLFSWRGALKTRKETSVQLQHCIKQVW